MNPILSFSEFETLYESYGLNTSEAYVLLKEAAQMAPPIPDAAKVVDASKPEQAEKKETSEEIFNIFKKLDNVEVKGGKVAEATTAAKATATANPFKIMRVGEQSDRVKILQKTLGVSETGTFDKATLAAVRKFQTDNKLKVDGLVGPQTYTKMLEILLKITEKSKIEEELEKIKKMSVNLINDARFYEIWQSSTVVVINNNTYIVCVPNSDAKSKVDGLVKDGAISSGFEWLLKAGEAVGQAVIYTAAAAILVPLAIAKGIVTGAISVIGYVAKGVVSALTSVYHGIGQVASLVYNGLKKGGAAVWNTLTAGGEGLVKMACTGLATAAKGASKAAEALVALAAGIGKAMVGASAAILNAAWTGVKAVGETVVTVWKGLAAGAKVVGGVLASAAKQGVQFIAKAAKAAGTAAVAVGKAIVGTVAAAGKVVYDVGRAVCTTAANVVKTVAKGAATVVAAGFKGVATVCEYAGKAANAVGDFFGSLFESIYEETMDPIFENAAEEIREYGLALAVRYQEESDY